jgi:flagellar motor switch/type III secretory pathway protein FliN
MEVLSKSFCVEVRCKEWMHSLISMAIHGSPMDIFNTPRSLDRLPISVSVTVCERKLKLNEFINWAPGTLLTFEHPANSQLTLRAGGREIGEGQPVKIGSKIGLRLMSVGTT